MNQEKNSLPKIYDPKGIEEYWYPVWESSGYFRADSHSTKEPFTIVIPPPNVTGVLHMGHALDNTLQDILIRYYRMQGRNALWLPGTDHAGIATQSVVERQLLQEGKSRQELGREAFLSRVWKWKEESGGKITSQLRRLGASCDWSRERFTMDEGLSRAVREVFVSLYHEGLIYRSSYLISWSPDAQTALSDLEVEYREIDGTLTYFRYPLDSKTWITVATTRPETMLGDTAIAVHPDDERYRNFVGKSVQHPFLNRRIPIIADSFVDPSFGTGAVKITPAHDPNDYEMGKRQNLDFITVIGKDAKMTLDAGPFAGLDRFEARKKVIEGLKSKNLLDRVEPYRHSVGHCQRTGGIIEPLISEQWFVKIAPLAEPAIQAVRESRTRFVPSHWSQTYLDWMENIRDWCISRQLWWGHRIPVWYCKENSHQTVAVDPPSKCSSCESRNLEQDPDVLDTWFSSALWPFSTLGWPDKTEDLKTFYPTSVLVTGFDIIFFWVARMMMMGIKFMKVPPFSIVHIHALVRDEHGQKMSKSKGNVVDPLEIMDQYGTDAFRFALASFAAQGRDISLSTKRIEGYRNFMNKIWNAFRFLQPLFEGEEVSSDKSPTPKTLVEQWILHRLNLAIENANRGIEEMRFNEAASALYEFIWHELCDWYLETMKIYLYRDTTSQDLRRNLIHTMVYVFDHALRAMHPISPFITEELWQRLPLKKKSSSIMISSYPISTKLHFPDAVAQFEQIMEIVNAIRVIRSENKIPPSKPVECTISTIKSDALDLISFLRSHGDILQALGKLSSLDVRTEKSKTKQTAVQITHAFEIHISLDGLVNTDDERVRLLKELQKAQEDVMFLQNRLSKPGYREKAPEKLVLKDEENLRNAQDRLRKIEISISQL